MLHRDTRHQETLRPRRKASKVGFVLEAIQEKGGVFKYQEVFQCDNGSEFNRDVTELFEKHDVNI